MGNLGGDGNENDKKNTVNVKNKKFSKHKFNFLKKKKAHIITVGQLYALA